MRHTDARPQQRPNGGTLGLRSWMIDSSNRSPKAATNGAIEWDAPTKSTETIRTANAADASHVYTQEHGSQTHGVI